MKTIAFTEWYRLSINGKTYTAKIMLVSERYYLVTKDPIRVFLISESKVDLRHEISLKHAREIGII